MPALRFYEYERIRGVRYQMDFWLDEESRFLNCRMRLVNEGKEVLPMYWWSNIAVEEYEGGRLIAPAAEAFAYADNSGYGAMEPQGKLTEHLEFSVKEESLKTWQKFFEGKPEKGK